MKFKWESRDQKTHDWELAKANLIVECKLLPDGSKFSRKDDKGTLHSFIVIDRRILAISSSMHETSRGKRYLGSGISGHAKLAQDESGHLYVLKIITNLREAGDFTNEANIARDLGIAGTPVTRMSNRGKNKAYIAYEYLGVSLTEFLQNNPGLTLQERYQLAIKIALMMDHFHEGEESLTGTYYVHGDIHGGNIVIDEKGQPKLIDFGRSSRGIDTKNDIYNLLLVLFVPSHLDHGQNLGPTVFGSHLGDYKSWFVGEKPRGVQHNTIYIYLPEGSPAENGTAQSLEYSLRDSVGNRQTGTIHLESPIDYQHDVQWYLGCSEATEKSIELAIRQQTDAAGWTTPQAAVNPALLQLLANPKVSRDMSALTLARELACCMNNYDNYANHKSEVDAQLGQISHALLAGSGKAPTTAEYRQQLNTSIDNPSDNEPLDNDATNGSQVSPKRR